MLTVSIGQVIRLRIFVFLIAALAVLAWRFILSPTSARVGAVSPDVVISQVYGAGGNSGASFQNDFIELFNRGNATVDLTGWAVQYSGFNPDFLSVPVKGLTGLPCLSPFGD